VVRAAGRPGQPPRGLLSVQDAAYLAKSVFPPDTEVARVRVKVRRTHRADEEELKRIKLAEKYHGPFDMDQGEVEWLTEED
jgi:hypothetical protein